jgi:hypothetical protein
VSVLLPISAAPNCKITQDLELKGVLLCNSTGSLLLGCIPLLVFAVIICVQPSEPMHCGAAVLDKTDSVSKALSPFEELRRSMSCANPSHLTTVLSMLVVRSVVVAFISRICPNVHVDDSPCCLAPRAKVRE